MTRRFKSGASPIKWDELPEVLTMQEVAALLRVSRNAAYQVVRAGIIPGVNFGSRRIRVSKHAIKEVLEPGYEHERDTAAADRDTGGNS